MTEPTLWPFALQAFCTFGMTGLIWFVQIVHYPLFAAVGPDQYRHYQERHMRLTTLVVGPLMLVEAAGALWALSSPPVFLPTWAAWIGIALLAVIWLSTLFLAVPRHQALSRGFSPAAHASLVSGNWIRTAAWSARSALLLFVLEGALP